MRVRNRHGDPSTIPLQHAVCSGCWCIPDCCRSWLVLRPSAPVRAAATLGSPLPNLTSLETTLFNGGLTEFNKTWDPTQGLGPVFTQIQCSVCHADPGVAGGNSKMGITFVGKYNSDGTYSDLPDEAVCRFSRNRFSSLSRNAICRGKSCQPTPPSWLRISHRSYLVWD